MSLKKTLARLLVLCVLDFGAVMGVPMTAEQIEKIMNVMNRVKIVQVIKKKAEE